MHHVQEAIRWQRQSQTPVEDRELARLAVGFVDLTGFTALSRHLPPAELIQVITQFESTAYDVAAELGGRIVKHIGDEIMFVALDAASGARIARSLLAALPRRTPSALAAGCPTATCSCATATTTARSSTSHPVSSMRPSPARSWSTRPPAEAAWAIDPDLVFEPAGQRLLRGFDEPVTTFSLS